MNYYTADLHFGHKNVIRFDNRPFESVEEMDAELILRWNSRVREEDTVYVLGDFAYRNTKPVKEYLQELKGRKVLIRGNHDKPWNDEYFDEVHDILRVKDAGENVILCHYYMPFYPMRKRDAIHLHGHTHANDEAFVEEEINKYTGELFEPARVFNVGCMHYNYFPVSLKEICVI